MKIVVSKDGPYLVSGNIPLRVQVITPNKEGISRDWKDGSTIETRLAHKGDPQFPSTLSRRKFNFPKNRRHSIVKADSVIKWGRETHYG